METGPLAACLSALVASLVGAGCGADPGRGTVRLALEGADPADCEAHCATIVQAQLLRDATDRVGLGPPTEPVACGEAVLLEGAPAGARVVVRAWVGDGFETLLEGTSEPVTVAGGEVVTATVTLTPLVTPSVTAVTPEPLVLTTPGAEATVIVEGAGFRYGDGDAALELEGAPLALDAWTDGRVEARVAAGAASGAVRVVTCGVASAPALLRVVGPAPGVTAVPLGECAGASLASAAAAPDGAGAVLGLACADGSGLALPIALAPGACGKALTGWALAGAPVALASRPGAAAVWAATTAPDRAVALDPATGATTASADLPAPPRPGALAVDAAGAAFVALAGAPPGEQLWWSGQGGGVVPGVATGLTLVDVAASPTEIVAVAAPIDPTSGAAGRLIRLSDPAAGFPPEWPLPTCPQPAALAVAEDGRWAAVACGGATPGVVAVPLAAAGGGGGSGDATFVPLAGVTPVDVALDAVGDVAFAADAQGPLAVILLGQAQHAATWTIPAGAASVTGLGALRRLVVGGPAGQALVLAPWQATDPCAAVTP